MYQLFRHHITLYSLAICLLVLPQALSFQSPFVQKSIAFKPLCSTPTVGEDEPKPAPVPRPSAGLTIDHEEPDDAIIRIAPKAMTRLRELRQKQDDGSFLILRMGVRNGGCSGLSYVMDFSSEDEIEEDDAVDLYETEQIKCVVDSKSMLYLYGLELDYSEELIGGGFKFFNPNAEESCGCGSSFGV
mmetsp:Transcript_20690/g.29065  ORF Transcript_20690/g.29065 Transcript_20690/m.29065 type:complete len:187 (+) Transcript_20690:54-614(+)